MKNKVLRDVQIHHTARLCYVICTSYEVSRYVRYVFYANTRIREDAPVKARRNSFHIPGAAVTSRTTRAIQKQQTRRMFWTIRLRVCYKLNRSECSSKRPDKTSVGLQGQRAFQVALFALRQHRKPVLHYLLARLPFNFAVQHIHWNSSIAFSCSPPTAGG